jgi:hypothetical protein
MRILIFILTFLLLVGIAFSQTTLQPGEATFTVGSVVLKPLPTEEDYTGAAQFLGLAGDLNYLNIRWNAYYYTGEERDIGVWCYLNCPNPVSPINVNCKDYQNCTYLGPSGKHSCSIYLPKYNFKNINNVTCRFYDPSNPSIEYLPYPNRTFYSIKFETSVSPVTITVGDPFTLPINVQNFGLLKSSFTTNISFIPSAFSPPVLIENPFSSTEEISYNQIASTFPRITFLATGNANFEIYSKSNIEPVPNFNTACNSNADCPAFAPYCVNNRCWAKQMVTISAGKKSLPEFDFFGIIFILLIATVLLALNFQNKSFKFLKK